MEDNYSFQKNIVAPVVVAFFSAIFAIAVGYFWESFRFQQETLFETRIQLIVESRKEANNIYFEFDRLKRLIRSSEDSHKATVDAKIGTPDYEKTKREWCNPQLLTREVNQLAEIGLRLEHLKENAKGIISDTTALYKSVKSFQDEVVKYKQCLVSNTNCKSCTDDFKTLNGSLRDVIQIHTKEINKEIGN